MTSVIENNVAPSGDGDYRLVIQFVHYVACHCIFAIFQTVVFERFFKTIVKKVAPENSGYQKKSKIYQTRGDYIFCALTLIITIIFIFTMQIEMQNQYPEPSTEKKPDTRKLIFPYNWTVKTIHRIKNQLFSDSITLRQES